VTFDTVPNVKKQHEVNVGEYLSRLLVMVVCNFTPVRRCKVQYRKFSFVRWLCRP
jgi:hypothetical protein